ncbi:MAG: SRPBCC family protein, partial [Reyranella sp.]
MATLKREFPVTAGSAAAWQAMRDFGAVHTKVAPGFLTALKMD